MSVTVKDCLKLPSLSLGQIIAGEKGLGNIVNLVDVIEFVLEGDAVNTPNTLFITALYAVKDDVEAQCRELNTYKGLGASAIVLFYQGLVVQALDERVIQTANRLNLPIIVMPGNILGLHYCDVIEEVMEAILIDRKDSQKFLHNTLDMISQLPPGKQNITSLLEFASSFSKASLFLCDHNMRMISYASWPRNYSEISLSDVLSIFEVPDFSSNMNTVKRSPGGAICHMKPVNIKGQGKLILYTYSQNDALTSSLMDQIAEMIQVFVTIWNYNLDFSRKNSVITLLLEGNNDLAADLIEKYNIDIHEYNTFLLLDEPKLMEKNDYIFHCEKQVKDILPGGTILVDSLRERIIMLIRTGEGERVDIKNIKYAEIFKSKISVVGENFNPLELKELYLKYCNCKENLNVIYPHERNFSIEQISFTDYCTQLSKSDPRKKENYISKIKPLFGKKNLDIIDTLAAYLLDYNSEIKVTADMLFAHRNTVQNRIQRAYELTGLNPGALPDSYELYLALALYRLGTKLK